VDARTGRLRGGAGATEAGARPDRKPIIRDSNHGIYRNTEGDSKSAGIAGQHASGAAEASRRAGQTRRRRGSIPALSGLRTYTRAGPLRHGAETSQANRGLIRLSRARDIRKS